MKRRILPLTIVGLLAFGTVLSSCGGEKQSTPISIDVTGVTISINNKNDLKAEWHVSDANRQVIIVGSKDINVNTLIQDGRLTITSSDDKVISVSGQYIVAVGAGTATITVKLNDSTDTVEITVSESLKEPDYKVATLAEVVAADDKGGDLVYLTTAKVSKWSTGDDATKYGRLYLKDGDAEVLAYGIDPELSTLTYKKDTKKYSIFAGEAFLTDERTKDIKIGDDLTVACIRADYNTTKQIKCVLLAVNKNPVYNATQTTDEVLKTPMNTTYLYKVTGKITVWAKGDNGTDYGNFSIRTEGSKETNDLVIYGASSSGGLAFTETGVWKFTNPKDFMTNEKSKDLKIGDTVTIVGVRCDYGDKVELQGIII